MLRPVLQAGGLVAVAAGLDTAVRGGRSFPPWRPADPMVESELRFYGAFYAAYGAVLLSTAGRAEDDPAALRPLAAALFTAGLARAGGWLTTGRPHPLQQALLVVELAAPPLALLAQGRRDARS